MNPAAIAAILSSLLGAAPQVFALFQRAKAGEPIAPGDVQAVLSEFGVDHAVFKANLEAAEAAQAATTSSESAADAKL